MENKHTECDTRDELAAKRENINTFDELINFIQDVRDNCQIGYCDGPRAIAEACVATAEYLAREFDITGFQACFVMWDIILGLQKTNSKTGLKLVDRDKMLHPKESDNFGRTLSAETWREVQNEAIENLSDRKSNLWLHPKVRFFFELIAEKGCAYGYRRVH